MDWESVLHPAIRRIINPSSYITSDPEARDPRLETQNPELETFCFRPPIMGQYASGDYIYIKLLIYFLVIREFSEQIGVLRQSEADREIHFCG